MSDAPVLHFSDDVIDRIAVFIRATQTGAVSDDS